MVVMKEPLGGTPPPTHTHSQHGFEWMHNGGSEEQPLQGFHGRGLRTQQELRPQKENRRFVSDRAVWSEMSGKVLWVFQPHHSPCRDSDKRREHIRTRLITINLFLPRSSALGLMCFRLSSSDSGLHAGTGDGPAVSRLPFLLPASKSPEKPHQVSIRPSCQNPNEKFFFDISSSASLILH